MAQLLSRSFEEADVMVNMKDELTQTAQWWKELLTASGGKLELPKCFYYIIKWTVNKHGDPILSPDPKIPIVITDHTVSEQVTVQQKDCSEAHKTLGAFKNPSESSDAQFKYLQKKTADFSRLVNGAAVKRHEGRVLHQSMYTPSVKYGLGASVLKPSQIDKIQNPAIAAILSSMGFNRHTPLAIRHGPHDLGGIGLLNLHTANGSSKVQQILQQIRLGRPLGEYITIALSWIQLLAGTKVPFLEDMKPITYLDEPWFDCVHQFLLESHASIKMQKIDIAPLR